MTRARPAPSNPDPRSQGEVRGLSPGRWIVLCAGAEAIGMTAAALAAKLAQHVLGDDPQATTLALAVLVAGGLVEGGALGALQASGLRRRLPQLNACRWRWVTTAVAGLGWAVASVPGVLTPDDGAPEPALPLVLAGALALGAVMGAILGAAQATTLRRLVRRPARWVLGNTLAWPPTMAVIFLGATTPESTWSTPSVAALGTVTGLVAGTALGVVTGRFLPGDDDIVPVKNRSSAPTRPMRIRRTEAAAAHRPRLRRGPTG